MDNLKSHDAILTDEISRAWSGMTTRQYKKLKGLKKENLRDNMSDLELVLTMLAEASTTDISKVSKPQGFSENQDVARQGGEVAGIARQALETRTGKPVVTSQNASDFRQLVTDIIEDASSLPESPEKISLDLDITSSFIIAGTEEEGGTVHVQYQRIIQSGGSECTHSALLRQIRAAETRSYKRCRIPLLRRAGS